MNTGYAITRLHPEVLDKGTRDAFANFVEPQYREFLTRKENTIAFGATYQGLPIGILIAECKPLIQTALIQTIFVMEEHRHHGVGTQLLEAFHEELKKLNYLLLLFTYSSDEPWAPSLEHIIATLGWPKPRIVEIECLFDAFTFDPPWIHLQITLPTGYNTFPWAELLPDQRRKLMHQQKSGLFPENLSPFNAEQQIEQLNSLGLEYKGEVIGWMITHRIAPDTIRYSSLFIQRRWQMSGVAILLLRDSILKQKQSEVHWAKLRLNIGDTESSWLQFVKRRLMPYAHHITTHKEAWKQLN